MKATPHASPRPLIVTAQRLVTATALLLASSLTAATSGVVGFYNVQIPVGNSAWVSGLVTQDLYEGAAASVTADVDGKALVQFSSPGWTGGEFTLHYAEPQSGSSQGLAIDILSNTTDTLKLNATPAAAGLTTGMTFIVRKHTTLGGLFPDGGGFAPFSDTISIFGTNGKQSSYFFSTISSGWSNVLFVDSNNVIIRPGQGFVFSSGTARTVTLGKGEVCHVKTTPTKITATALVPNLVGAINPLSSTSTTLGSLGITPSLGVFSDSIVPLGTGNLTQLGTYLSTGSGLVNSATFQSGDNVTIGAGASVVLNVGTTKTVTLTPVIVSP